MTLRNAQFGRVRWMEGQLSKTAEVLGNGGERELELRTAGPLSLNRPMRRMRFKCANSIST